MREKVIYFSGPFDRVLYSVQGIEWASGNVSGVGAVMMVQYCDNNLSR